MQLFVHNLPAGFESNLFLGHTYKHNVTEEESQTKSWFKYRKEYH